MTEMSKEDWQDLGESARQALGIDGTMGDAQDVKHAYHETAMGPGCLVCGLSEKARAHRH